MHFVYYLHHDDDIPFYVGQTKNTEHRLGFWRVYGAAFGHDSVRMTVLAKYATKSAADGGEVAAWESLTRLGFRLNNERPWDAGSARRRRAQGGIRVDRSEVSIRGARAMTAEQRSERGRKAAATRRRTARERSDAVRRSGSVSA